MTCTFFGHSQIHNYNEVISKLYDTVYELVEERGIRDFLVGSNGDFDRMALDVLRQISKSHKVSYSVVLAYLNIAEHKKLYQFEETVYPELLERTPKHYAIDKRNHWMTRKSEIAITYVNTCIGGAAKFAEICEKRGMEIIKLGKI